MLNRETQKYADCESYVRKCYLETIKNTPKLPGESINAHKRRELFYLNIHWFMTSLLERKDRMSMYSGLEVRVPFADHELAQYVWNIPWHIKTAQNRKKGILRQALAGILPNDVLNRPKSPYPKTHNPKYAETVKEMLQEILNSPNEPINRFINKQALQQSMQSQNELNKPFFGQLMSQPQMYAFFLQVNFWLKEYKVSCV